MTEPSPRHPPSALEHLAARGVALPAPEQVFIGREVPLERIAPGAVLHPFTRLTGAATRIDAGAVIGAAGPATLHDAWVGAGAVVGNLGPVTLRAVTAGPGTVLGCGVAEQAVFLGKEVDDPAFTTGYGFRVRAGSLYEEDANSAQHTDTKMTLLFPWVTLGSNVNWCDVLVAGGTGPGLGEFTEVGSGVIHFNFTPRGDKATASLLGDACGGVFLRSPRLFVGGNASLIGPVQADYGAMAGAGGRLAGHLRPGLQPPAPAPAGGAAFHPEVYGAVDRVYRTQVAYIAELAALDAWYGQVRALVAAGAPSQAELYARGRAVVAANLTERIAQLGAFAARMERSVALLERSAPGDPRIAQQRALLEGWPAIEAHLRGYGAAQDEPPRTLTVAVAEGAGRLGRVYTRVVQGLPAGAVEAGTAWLRGVAGRVASAEVLTRVPPLGSVV